MLLLNARKCALFGAERWNIIQDKYLDKLQSANTTLLCGIWQNWKIKGICESVLGM